MSGRSTTLRARHRRAVAAGLVALAVAATAVVAEPPGRPVGAAPGRSACPASPFTTGFAAALADQWPGHPFTASVHDTSSGCDYVFRPDTRITTASVLKAEIMAGVLLRAQQAGRGLTQWEKDRIFPMITQSADGPAGQLWSSLGGVAGMQAVDRAFGLTQTVQAAPWGLTRTSAADRTRLQRQLLLGEYGPLNATSRAIARSYMLAVVPSQRWGITAGVPSSWKVPLKNGFFPSQCCAWRINSSGVVERPDGTAYAATILSDGWSSERQGIEAVEFVSRVVAASFAADVAPFRSAAACVDQQYADLFARSPTFGEARLTTEYIGSSSGRVPTVIAGLLVGGEFDRTGAAVLRLYLGSLGRLPDPATYHYRVWQLTTRRLSAVGLADQLAASVELVGHDGLGDDAFVDRVVQRALGRLPSAAARADWVALLRAGVGRGVVLEHFAQSGEARRARQRAVLVAAVHLAMLERAPSASALATWEARLAAGTPLLDLVATVYRSSEYRHRVT